MKLIDKDAVASEIEKRKKRAEKRLYINNSYSEEGNAAWERDEALYNAYNSLLSFLDTIEAKEVCVDLGDPKGDKSARYIIDTKNLFL